MNKKAAAIKVVPLRMTASRAESIIRERAQDTSKVFLGTHAKERSLERGIYKDDIYRILRNGGVRGEPEPAREGEWKCKVVMRLRGSRDAGVVTIILVGDGLFIKTVEWEDLR